MLKKFDINSDFIAGWFLEDLDLCDDLIKFFEASNKKVTGTIGFGPGERVDKEVKDSTDVVMTIDEPIVRRYNIELQKVTEEYKKLFPKCDEVSAWKIQSANLQKYNPNGGFFRWHAERMSGNAPSCYRHLVFMTYLNDIQDGGETEFYHQKIKVKPQKGLTLIWPADWTHTHRGIPAPTETKYIATGWYGFI